MKNLAPEIFRQRLLIEGYYSAAVTREFVEEFLNSIAAHLGLRAARDDYRSPLSGRQFVVVAEGDRPHYGTKPGTKLVAFALLQPKGNRHISERVSHAKFVAAFKECVSDGMRCP